MSIISLLLAGLAAAAAGLAAAGVYTEAHRVADQP